MINRVGEVRLNRLNTKMKIIKYNNAREILIEFQDEYKTIVKNNYENFKSGEIKNPYDLTIFNIGYIGIGDYKPSTHRIIYLLWHGMMRRCYDDKYHATHPTYKDCTVCEEWLNFQNFAKWHENNYYEIDGEKMCLDKDILVKGNKIYSPEACIFVPNNINMLFVTRSRFRGITPLGVYYDKRRRKYISQSNDGFGGNVYLGGYDDEYSAFYVYKTYKEQLIKDVANKYKNSIPIELYNALCHYQIEVSD